MDIYPPNYQLRDFSLPSWLYSVKGRQADIQLACLHVSIGSTERGPHPEHIIQQIELIAL